MISGGGGFGFSGFVPNISMPMTMNTKKALSAAEYRRSAVCHCDIVMGHIPTDFRMLSHLTSSIIVRNSPRLTNDLLCTSCCSLVSMRKCDSAGRVTNLDGDIHLLLVILGFVLPVVQFHLDSASKMNGLNRHHGMFAHSCFRFATSSFIRPSSASTSLRRAALAVRMAADSFRVRIVSSVRSSESAALNRYACCRYYVARQLFQRGWDCRRHSHFQGLSLSAPLCALVRPYPQAALASPA